MTDERTVMCEECSGLGWVPKPLGCGCCSDCAECRYCEGTGQVEPEADEDAQVS